MSAALAKDEKEEMRRSKQSRGKRKQPKIPLEGKKTNGQLRSARRGRNRKMVGGETRLR